MSTPDRLHLLRDALALLRDEAEPPAHLVNAAIALHRVPSNTAWGLAEVFPLLAAASDEAPQGLVCTSQSGLWTLEIFVGLSPEDQAAGRGQVLLTVHADHRATYEGRRAKVFIATAEGERVLADAEIVDGALFADITLTGLDLQRRDAVNVVFGPA